MGNGGVHVTMPNCGTWVREGFAIVRERFAKGRDAARLLVRLIQVLTFAHTKVRSSVRKVRTSAPKVGTSALAARAQPIRLAPGREWLNTNHQWPISRVIP